VLLCYKDAGLS